MTVPAVGAYTAVPATAAVQPGPTASATAAEPGALDKDAFLQLLVASLKYQDPSTPMDTAELMAQTTQLTTMEQLTEMTRLSQESFALQQRASATALIGQHITYTTGEGAGTGRVTAVDLTAPVPTVLVDDRPVPLDTVTGVVAPPTA